MATVTIRFGGKHGSEHTLRTSERLLVVRTTGRQPVSLASARVSASTRRALQPFSPIVRFAEQGVEVLQLPGPDPVTRDAARRALASDPGVQFAGRALVADVAADTAPRLYTENVFVQFEPGVKGAEARRLLGGYRLTVKRKVPYLEHAYFAAAPAGIGLPVFDLALDLLSRDGVRYCHPEIVRERCHRAAFAPQWHLKKTKVGGRTIDQHASVTAAWTVTKGKGCVIAVIDDGMDVDHEEFRTAGKIVSPWDATGRDDDPRPSGTNRHGTACAGVACANGLRGASGVAPAAKLMPIRLMSPLGAQNEGDAFAWAADHGADVISCSWGPTDGDWWDAGDPQHDVVEPLPDSTRLAIEYAATQGRQGKGCVVLFAAGNGNERVENDGYASHEHVLAIAACNDRGSRSVYSDMGAAVWCAFPSNDFEDPDTGHLAPLTPGIWTTDRSGHAGYNPGDARRGDAAGNYTNSFGGTSSACPGAAGVVALMLSANPALTPADVRAILRDTSDRIDPVGAAYDSTGHSDLYGYGRVNAARAVRAAKARLPRVARRRSRASRKK